LIRIAELQIGADERAAVMAVLDSGQLAAGPVTKRFEETFAREVSHTREAVAVVNGTAALHLALLAHGVGPGDEVVTTPFTFQATSNMVLAAGARPVFVDICEDGNIDVSQVEAAITPRTKAVLPVHLYGRLCAIAELSDIAARHGVALIEDAAQAHGAELKGRRAGSFGTGCFSFYATKNVMTGEGGMISTDDPALAEKLRVLRSHGQSERYFSTDLGFNYRTTDLAAAIGLPQLARLDQFNERRRHNAAYLSKHLRGVILPPEPEESGACVWHQFTVRVPGGAREALQAWLRERGVDSAVHYPHTLPAQQLYRDLGYDEAQYPTARKLASEVLSLPVHPGLTQTDLEAIVAGVNGWAEQAPTLEASR
jgi:dTDP-4-amino-4,6-dideoxygalactose transaminase